MKKLSILCAAVLAAIAACAQPQAGSFGVELNFNPFNNGAAFSTQGLKVRYFFNEKMAVRGTIDFSAAPRTDFNYITEPDREIEYKTRSNVGSFGIAPGFEYHFVTFGKGSVYGGAEVSFDLTTASCKMTNSENDNMVLVKGYSAPDLETSGTRAGTRFEQAFFTGVDYYIFKKLYIGAELGLRFATSREGKVTMKTVVGENSTETTTKDYSTSSTFGFYAEPSFRLGWTF